ncbi:MAG: hypothetical protein ACRDY3_03605, partial [Acidimicrobiales bacterium]
RACSFTDQSVVTLGTLTLPQTKAGRDLSTVVRATLVWETSDALGCIEDIQTLEAHPADAAAKANLAKEERLIASDRALAMHEMQRVNRDLGGAHIRGPRLPQLPKVT